jgi:RNA binding exosome subunit
MKIAHFVEVSVFSHENEDYQTVKAGLVALFPFGLENEKIRVNESSAEGISGGRIRLANVCLEKERHTTAFLENLLSGFGNAQVSALISQIESRLDEELFFFMRIDKDSWNIEKKTILTDSGNCYHIRITVAAFPKKRESAVALLNRFLCGFAGKTI